MFIGLDLSTKSSGYSVFEKKGNYIVLLASGRIKIPKVKGLSKLKYPVKALIVSNLMSREILKLSFFSKENEIESIFIEEICKGKARIGQKVLDGLHFLFLDKLNENLLDRVKYIDVIDWRSALNIKLSEKDKLLNKDIRKQNKILAKKDQVNVISHKHKACEFVNEKFGLNLNVDLDEGDSDEADAICVGYVGTLNAKK